jgi:hypothetical protein
MISCCPIARQTRDSTWAGLERPIGLSLSPLGPQESLRARATPKAEVAEPADAADSKSVSPKGSVGSTPTFGTILSGTCASWDESTGRLGVKKRRWLG